MPYEPRGQAERPGLPESPRSPLAVGPRKGTWISHVSARLTMIPIWTKARSDLANAVPGQRTADADSPAPRRVPSRPRRPAHPRPARRTPAADRRPSSRTGRPDPDGGRPVMHKKKSSPRKGGYPDAKAASLITTPEGGASEESVTDAQGKTQNPRRRRWAPIASASLYEPDATRTWWWLSIRCPWCGCVHLGRFRQEQDAPGPRRASCGRRILVVVRRTYRGRTPREAA